MLWLKIAESNSCEATVDPWLNSALILDVFPFIISLLVATKVNYVRYTVVPHTQTNRLALVWYRCMLFNHF